MITPLLDWVLTDNGTQLPENGNKHEKPARKNVGISIGNSMEQRSKWLAIHQPITAFLIVFGGCNEPVENRPDAVVLYATELQSFSDVDVLCVVYSTFFLAPAVSHDFVASSQATFSPATLLSSSKLCYSHWIIHSNWIQFYSAFDF